MCGRNNLTCGRNLRPCVCRRCAVYSHNVGLSSVYHFYLSLIYADNAIGFVTVNIVKS